MSPPMNSHYLLILDIEFLGFVNHEEALAFVERHGVVLQTGSTERAGSVSGDRGRGLAASLDQRARSNRASATCLLGG